MMMDGVPGIPGPVKAAAAHSVQDVHPVAGGIRAVAGADREHQGVHGQGTPIAHLQAAWGRGSGAASAASPSSRSV